MKANLTVADQIRSAFSAAMSVMYRNEVPAYGKLMELVAQVNDDVLVRNPELRIRLSQTDALARISDERHGAIRVGTRSELTMIRRIFAVMGMHPVGYYDLSTAGVPVHATAFRPIGEEPLSVNPFRVFASLLRLDLIADEALRREAAAILEARQIFTAEAIALTEKAECDGTLSAPDAKRFVSEVLETFRWHGEAHVNSGMYKRLHDAHRLIADVVSFRGPHINHLTPRTLDIDQVQKLMPANGISPKAVIEGPPRRRCPILLRQTSFKALEEPVKFWDVGNNLGMGAHTARFGEVEQRGIALTKKGRALYDELLREVHHRIRPAPDGSNATEYQTVLSEIFQAFPDSWNDIRRLQLGYFRYTLTNHVKRKIGSVDVEALIAEGVIRFDPITYEDFLPVSAAGIFQSNLGDNAQHTFEANPSQKNFESDLGVPVLDEFDHYAAMEQASLDACLAASTLTLAAERV
ncbi:VOC family protein [Rhizobium leguminosarum]|uniref:2-oxoadipate dioxygenase/decarboxylase HglS n=1 Tax=Rhizobium leguminosarum TaxID=384 RepID=UPI001C9527F2|nr:VOC family protein [Rhizobium leguminosarum]MBY5406687.1 VOC family protein [Rhizobium leguminosarum]